MPSGAVREWVHMISSMCVCLLAMCCYLQIKTKQLVVAVVLKELTNIMIPFLTISLLCVYFYYWFVLETVFST